VSSEELSLAERTRNCQILSGHFNIDFSTKKSKSLIDFLKTVLNLNIYLSWKMEHTEIPSECFLMKLGTW
jgi:hypothetical protein